METKKRFSCIDEELFADVCGTVKAQESKKEGKQQAFAIVDAEVVSLDGALKGNKNCMAVVIRACEKHAGNRNVISDVKMLKLLHEQLSEVVGKRFSNLCILSKENVLIAIADYLYDAEPCILCDVISTVNSIYSNGFIISAE